MQMRFLQTVADTGNERSTMFVLPLPIDLLSSFQRMNGRRNEEPIPHTPPDVSTRQMAS